MIGSLHLVVGFFVMVLGFSYLLHSFGQQGLASKFVIFPFRKALSLNKK
jgi:hypothetical protein